MLAQCFCISAKRVAAVPEIVTLFRARLPQASETVRLTWWLLVPRAGRVALKVPLAFQVKSTGWPSRVRLICLAVREPEISSRVVAVTVCPRTVRSTEGAVLSHWASLEKTTWSSQVVPCFEAATEKPVKVLAFSGTAAVTRFQPEKLRVVSDWVTGVPSA